MSTRAAGWACPTAATAAEVTAARDAATHRRALSRHTVGDHVKSVFGKLAVHSRAELTARLYFGVAQDPTVHSGPAAAARR